MSMGWAYIWYLTCPHISKFPPENELLTLNDCLITHLNNTPHHTLPFMLCIPKKNSPDSQITGVSWGGKEGNHLRLKISPAAVAAGRKRGPRPLAEGQIKGPHCNRTALWSEQTGAVRHSTEVNWTARCQKSPIISTWPSHAPLFSPEGLGLHVGMTSSYCDVISPPFFSPTSPSSAQPPAFRSSWGKFGC